MSKEKELLKLDVSANTRLSIVNAQLTKLIAEMKKMIREMDIVAPGTEKE